MTSGGLIERLLPHLQSAGIGKSEDGPDNGASHDFEADSHKRANLELRLVHSPYGSERGRVGLRQMVIEHISSMSGSYRDLIETLPEPALAQQLTDRSNSIGAQMWCVVGARESYTHAIESDGWVGFSCSLSGADTISKTRVLEALSRSEDLLVKTIDGIEWTDTRDGLLLDLLEHETQHQGQLIRYLYALDLRIPESWARRWALDQPG